MTKPNGRAFVCLYHRTNTDKTSREDIVQKAFGGKKTSTTLICADCNNYLGRTIDQEFAESLEWVTSLVNPPSRRKSAATLANVVDSRGETWHLKPGGRPVVPFTSIGPSTWKGDVSHLEMAHSIAENLAKKNGVSDPKITVTHQQTTAAPIKFELLLNNEVAFRSGCKTALEYLALIAFDNDDRLGDLLLDARDFVMKGGSYGPIGWLENSVVEKAFDALDHHVALIQSEDNSIYWEFILYGGIVAISGRFSSINRKIESALYSVCTTTGEASEERASLPAVSNDFVSWEAETNVHLQMLLEKRLQKLNVVANIHVDSAIEHADQLTLNTNKEYINAGFEHMVQQALKLAASYGTHDPKAVRKAIMRQLKQEGIDVSSFR